MQIGNMRPHVGTQSLYAEAVSIKVCVRRVRRVVCGLWSVRRRRRRRPYETPPVQAVVSRVWCWCLCVSSEAPAEVWVWQAHRFGVYYCVDLTANNI